MTNRKVNNLIATAVAVLLLVTSAPLQASNADGRITSSAEKSYVFKSYLKNDAIKVQSKDGVVTLTGTVSRESHKAMAEETVIGLPSVKSVSNQLIVTAAPTSANSDLWLTERVKNTLLIHRSVSFANSDVTVIEGKVTLRGEASSEAQKQLSTEYASDVLGVKDVDNQMTVSKFPAKSYRTKDQKVDDASITTQVMMSMRYHHGMDVFDTKVSTHKGVVTLGGTALNQAEIDLATKRVSDIHGVKRVNNHMTIDLTQAATK
ncbi:MAG: BON domain-containing protein [Candidatus Zixiibacteriota bacterium]